MPVEFVVALVAVFFCVALIVGLAAFAAVPRSSPAKRGLASFVRTSGRADVVRPASLTKDGLDPTLARWSMLLPKSTKDMSVLERRLASGGYHSARAVVAFSTAPRLLAALLGVVVLGWFGLMNQIGWVLAGVAAVAGYLGPELYLDQKISKRRRQIRSGLPDVLDLLIVCLEAGSSLDQSVVKAGEELGIAYPALSEELRVLTTETRAGKPRLEAFRNLAERTKVEDVRALVSMLVQTDRFGTSIAQALRAMADDMRTRRRQSAEERAAKVGVKLVFPLVFFMFPALFVVVLGPALIEIARVFSRQLK